MCTRASPRADTRALRTFSTTVSSGGSARSSCFTPRTRGRRAPHRPGQGQEPRSGTIRRSTTRHAELYNQFAEELEIPRLTVRGRLHSHLANDDEHAALRAGIPSVARAQQLGHTQQVADYYTTAMPTELAAEARALIDGLSQGPRRGRGSHGSSAAYALCRTRQGTVALPPRRSLLCDLYVRRVRASIEETQVPRAEFWPDGRHVSART